MSGSALQLWVAVAARGELDQLRRAGLNPTVVTEAGGTPLYGRPGEGVCVRFEVSPAPGAAQRALGRLPLRAGILVKADPDGVHLLDLARARGRRPLAVSVGTREDARLALAHQAEVLVVAGPDGIGTAREAGGAVTIVARVGDEDGADRAIRAGANGLLVGAELAVTLAARPELAGRRQPVPSTAGARRSGGGLPAVPATIGAILERTSRRHPDQLALVHVAAERRLTFEQLRGEVRAIARAMLAQGIEHGDRVAISARNVPEWPLVQLATASVGAILVAIGPSSSEDELRFVLERSRSRLLLAAPRSDPGAEALAGIQRARPARLEAIVELPAGSGGSAAEGSDPWSAFLRAGEAIPESALAGAGSATRPDDTASILYTSGTTGSPKGAMLSHRGMLQNAAAVGGNLRLTSADRLCLPVPFHHCFGSVMGTLAALWFGAALVIPNDWFDAGRTLDAVAAERCTILYGVPTMFTAELEANRSSARDLASLRSGIISGAPVSGELAAANRRRSAHPPARGRLRPDRSFPRRHPDQGRRAALRPPRDRRPAARRRRGSGDRPGDLEAGSGRSTG